MAGNQTWSIHLTLVTLTVLFIYTHQATAIGCFVCSSVNRSEPDCEDTFNNTNRYYVPTCYAGRKKRMGLFPATNCIKMKASVAGTGHSVLVRTCVVDNGDINSETEIGRSDHCGFVNFIKYDDSTMRGCILSCDTNGCNIAASTHTAHAHAIILALFGSLVWCIGNRV